MWRLVNLVASIAVAAGLLLLAARGAGPLPPLGPTFNPGTGVWTAAADARAPTASAFHLAGLQRPVQILFESNGIAHVRAASDHDVFLTVGYLHARFRLFQMDLLRRQGEGLLSQIVGGVALPSDRFELRLGLVRTAAADWRLAGPEERGVLQAYARGVNDRILEDREQHNFPLLFKMLGYEPEPWRPIDTLVIKGIMTQTLDFTDTPLDYAVLSRTLGYRRTMRWFPILPANPQHPYDPAPYGRARQPAPLPSQRSVTADVFGEVASVLNGLKRLPSGALHGAPDSNNWAVNGPRVASGKSLMAGDPHLHQTLPAIWYELTLDSPGFHEAGVSIPGTPVVLIGHNRHISWSLTNTQNQAALYYLERTAPAHPHQYFWRGAWRTMRTVHYSIPLKGGGSSNLSVHLTVHGPVMTDKRLAGTITVDWMGNLPSPDLDVLLNIGRARNFAQFRAALQQWHAPSQNFVYADDRGNIGLISAGYYPLVRRGAPWLPLPGDGSADVAGTVPYAAVPQVYDPPTHLVFSANQRPVGSAYPYYIGTSLDFFDNGYRADRIWQALHAGKRLTAADMERLQLDVHDYLAARIVPKLLAALNGTALSTRERQAANALRSWNGGMDGTSTAASVWWSFWDHYLHATFDPWWRAAHVPSRRFHSVEVGSQQTSLDEDLEAWTVGDVNNPAFSLPDGKRRSAPEVMRVAFVAAVRSLSHLLGPKVDTWRWARLHSRRFPSLAEIPSLGYGPRGNGGDPWTVDAADGGLTSEQGPSWRFVMDWGSGRAYGVYPGGQAENPVSSWYETGVPVWWAGRYFQLVGFESASAFPGSTKWSLRPSP